MRTAFKSCILWRSSAFMVFAPPAHAQGYPVKEITAVCPFAAGTGADITVRYFSAKLSEVLGKPVIVLNKAGATGNIASETVAKAKPDGYTISITPASSTMAAAPYLYKKLPFDPIKDFTPVTTLASLPFVLIVDAKKPIHSVADLVKHLKSRDGGFYGGSNNTGIVAAELFKDATKIDAKARRLQEHRRFRERHDQRPYRFHLHRRHLGGRAGEGRPHPRDRSDVGETILRAARRADVGGSGLSRHRAHAVVGRVPAGGDAAADRRQARVVLRSHRCHAGDDGVSDQVRQ